MQPSKKEAEGEGSVEELDLFGEEVKRRTVGMEMEAQLVEFLECLKGEWGGRGRRRRLWRPVIWIPSYRQGGKWC